MFSFFMSAVVFLVTGLTLSIAPIWVLIILFFLSSFVGQFGANATTYVMAAETYPTELRSTCHGVSAFAGMPRPGFIVIGFVRRSSAARQGI
jgi:PHS family inorganic phosphate transporter-like MFS transporter